jgi:hypothetical protein
VPCIGWCPCAHAKATAGPAVKPLRGCLWLTDRGLCPTLHAGARHEFTLKQALVGATGGATAAAEEGEAEEGAAEFDQDDGREVPR